VYGSLNAVVPTGTPSGVYNDSIIATLYY
jgi:hypothetical protein